MSDRATEKMNGASSGKVPQNQKDLFVDYRELNVYHFLEDLYEAKGGVSGRTASQTSYQSFWEMLGFGKKNTQKPYSFINPNPTENFYPTRVRKSMYTNFYRQYIDTKVRGVFKITPKTSVQIGDIDQPDHQYLDWIKDVNGAGLSKNMIYQNLMVSVYRDEVAFLVMDKFTKEDDPHLYIQTAKTVESYETDPKGKLTHITFVNCLKDGSYEKNVWGPLDVTTHTSPDGKKWKEGETKTIVGTPILSVFASPRTDPHDYLPQPQSNEIGALCVSIYDSGSLLDWLLEKQGHDIMYTNGDIDGVREGMTNIVKLSTVDGTASMGILSPDANKATVHQARIDQKKDDLFQLMLDGGVLVSKNNNAPESGLAKSYTFAPVNDALQDTVKILGSEGVDRWVQGQYKVYEGDANAKWVATTHYRADFSPVQRLTLLDLEGLLQTFERRGLMDNAKHILKQLIISANNGESQSVANLLQEIDEKFNIRVEDGVDPNAGGE